MESSLILLCSHATSDLMGSALKKFPEFHHFITTSTVQVIVFSCLDDGKSPCICLYLPQPKYRGLLNVKFSPSSAQNFNNFPSHPELKPKSVQDLEE